jgi:hypothetical protein
MSDSPAKVEQIRDAVRLLVGVLGALGGVAVIVVLLYVLIDRALVKPQVAGALTDQQRYDLLAKARAEDHRLLTTYGWVDKTKGTVRIPVEAAMQKMLEEAKQ